MAPRKSNASAATAADANGDVSMVSNATATSTHAHSKPARQSGAGKQDDGVSIDDLLLPRTLVSRLARGVLPPNTSIQKDAILAIAKSATVFISYLAHHANEQTAKKTIGPQDVLKALKEIEMAGVMELGAVGPDGRLGGRLEREMEAYEEMIQKKRKGYRDKVKARESLAGDADGEEDNDGAERGEPSSKKARRMDDDEDGVDQEGEEQRLLEQQLNGTSLGPGSAQTPKAKRNSNGMNGHSSPGANGKARALPNEPDVEEADEGEDEPADEEDDEEEEDEEEEADEDEDEEDEHEDHDTDEVDDIDGRQGSNGRARPLMVGRDVDVGSEDESD